MAQTTITMAQMAVPALWYSIMVDLLAQVIPNTAAAHESDDGRDADVDIPMVDDERNEIWDDLRDDTVDHHLEAVGACSLQGFDRTADRCLRRLRRTVFPGRRLSRPSGQDTGKGPKPSQKAKTVAITSGS